MVTSTRPIREVGKGAVRSLGMATARLRPLPDFLIIGTKRGGTSALHRYLLEHPQSLPLFPSARYLPMRADIKGVHYFDTGFDRGDAWYRSHFPTRVHRRLGEQRGGSRVVAGEASPYYLYHPLAAARARRVVPHAHLIVMLRDPVERAHSHYREQRRRGFEQLPTFEQALEAEPARTAGQEEQLADGVVAASFAHEHQSYVGQSRYLRPLTRWLEAFPRDQVCVLRSEDFFEDVHGTYAQVLAFLGLRPHQLRDPRPVNGTGGPAMASSTRRQLRATFGPEVAGLEQLLQRPLDWDI
jgi:Sulfotransferase family